MSGLKVWDGSAFVDGVPKVWDGSEFANPVSAHIWDGSEFQQVYSGVTYTDDFNRANSTTSAGPNWTNRRSQVGVNSNVAYGAVASATAAATYNSAMITDDHKVSVTLPAGISAGRSHTIYIASGTDIQCRLRIVNTGLDIRTTTDWGISTTSRATYSGSFANGDVLSLERKGTVFTARQNGTARCTWNDTTGVMPRDSSHRLVGIGQFNPGGVQGIDDFIAEHI